VRALGRWEAPQESIASQSPPPPENDLDALWNDFHSEFQATVSDAEDELTAVLAGASALRRRSFPRVFNSVARRRTGDTSKSKRTSRTTA